MSINTIEQVVAEWYDLRGYFIRRNIMRPNPPRGQTDLDVVAFHPNTRHMIHIEGSTASERWSAVKLKMEAKFPLDRAYLARLYPDLPLEQLLVYYRRVPDEHLDSGIRILAFPDLLSEIRAYLKTHRLDERKVPEAFPLLRVLHHAAQFWRP